MFTSVLALRRRAERVLKALFMKVLMKQHCYSPTAGGKQQKQRHNNLAMQNEFLASGNCTFFFFLLLNPSQHWIAWGQSDMFLTVFAMAGSLCDFQSEEHFRLFMYGEKGAQRQTVYLYLFYDPKGLSFSWFALKSGCFKNIYLKDVISSCSLQNKFI